MAKWFGKKKDKSKLKYFNCQVLDYFTWECPEPKNVALVNNFFSVIYVSNIIMLTKYNPIWIVDSRATNRVPTDREAFVEYRRFLASTMDIRWRDDKVEVKGIGTCKLHLRGSYTIFFHDVLFISRIRINLIFIIILLRLGMILNFCGTSVWICNANVYYGHRYVSSSFEVLNCDPNTYNYYIDHCFSMSVSFFFF